MMKRTSPFCWLLGAAVLCSWFPSHPLLSLGADFERDVAPILVRRCIECHSGAEATGGLDLSTSAGLAKGGDSGNSVVPGKLDESLLWQRVHDGDMPPKKQGKSQALPEKEVELLRTWIIDGARWPEGRTLNLFEATTDKRAGRDWWSLQPIQQPTPPVVRNAKRVANPIDNFIWHSLESRQWALAPAADKRTLLRRLYIDLIGLPPTFQEVTAFEQDSSSGAYEAVVDRLLASPRYGERWGRYWLDIVRYAETCGYERDQVKPNVWKYRDWVIRAFNDDLPFDRFILEQLAGDELPNRSEQSIIATGFLRLLLH